MKPNRRRFLSLMGVGAASAPLTARAITDAETAKGMNYEQRLIGATDYVKMFGLPSTVEARLRDESRNIYCLDADIACKQSWSMSVKIMTQRERNYQRGVQRIHASALQERSKRALTKLLGFEWPF